MNRTPTSSELPSDVIELKIMPKGDSHTVTYLLMNEVTSVFEMTVLITVEIMIGRKARNSDTKIEYLKAVSGFLKKNPTT